MLVRGSPDHKAIAHNNFWGILGGKTVPKLFHVNIALVSAMLCQAKAR